MKEIQTLSVIERALLLLDWEFFKPLASDEVALIAARTREVEYEAGEIIDPEGPTGSSLHILIAGSVELSVEGSPFRRAGPGEAFGGGALLGVDVEGEELSVLEAVHSLVLSREEFERTVADHPDFALACIRALFEAVRGRRDLLPESGKEA